MHRAEAARASELEETLRQKEFDQEQQRFEGNGGPVLGEDAEVSLRRERARAHTHTA
jgi:hypothetical protein